MYTAETPKDEIYNILRHVLDNEVVMAFNLSGTGRGLKKKKAFQVLRLYKVLKSK
jgi:hypothetical protein